MNTYLLLLQNLTGFQEFVIPISELSNSNFWSCFYNMKSDQPELDSVIFLFFSTFIRKLKSSTTDFMKDKFKEIDDMLTNIFITDIHREQILEYIYKTQKHYNALSRFAHSWKFKRAPVQITTDLYMNDIDQGKFNVFTLLQNGFKYHFVISDLINIINTSLTNSVDFFVEPRVSKNPYNNIEFTVADMYNIYFFIKNRNIMMPRLIEGLFQTNMNLDLFELEYEALLREINIRNCVNNFSEYVLYCDIIQMLRTTCIPYTRFLNIHEDFPINTLVSIMKPYLHLYYTSMYYIEGTIKRSSAEKLLYKKLRLFVKFNPQFGRKEMCRDFLTQKRVVSYNMRHIEFNKNYDESSMVYHLPEEEYVEFNRIRISSLLYDDGRELNSTEREYSNEEDEIISQEDSDTDSTG